MFDSLWENIHCMFFINEYLTSIRFLTHSWCSLTIWWINGSQFEKKKTLNTWVFLFVCFFTKYTIEIKYSQITLEHSVHLNQSFIWMFTSLFYSNEISTCNINLLKSSVWPVMFFILKSTTKIIYFCDQFVFFLKILYLEL